ncbi:MAG TPA: YceI family protein [Acidimicrobiales bacterium]|nr:YceI family protein [Acidimicrobiales bacterium]
MTTNLGGSNAPGRARGYNGLAIASLVLGIIWLGGLGALLAVVLGLVGLSQIKRSGDKGRGVAIAGVVLGAIGLLVPITAVGILIASNRDDPPELSVDNGSSDTSQTTTGTVPASLDGTWSVRTGGDTTAGFRIEESFASGLTDHTAVGRSDDVSGSITVDGTEITEAAFTVGLDSLEFTDDPGLPVGNRANALKQNGLETDTFPEASFELTEPIDFGAKPAEGETVTASATGDLTIHGVTKSVTFDVEAKIVGDTIRVATAEPVPVALADYGIDKPTMGPVASIADAGSFEFLVVLGQE